jgi:hypothetical protein
MRSKYNKLPPAVDVAMIYRRIKQWFEAFSWNNVNVLSNLGKEIELQRNQLSTELSRAYSLTVNLTEPSTLKHAQLETQILTAHKLEMFALGAEKL